MPLHAPVLVLNASYEPINVCAARRAIILVLKGVATTEEINGNFIHAARISMRFLPLSVYSSTAAFPTRHVPSPEKTSCCATATPANIAVELLPSSELTLDHVVPRSRGGASTWENLVACCHACNRQKGNQFPHEADMKLLREPRAFNLHTSRHIMRIMGRSDDKWRKYLFY